MALLRLHSFTAAGLLLGTLFFAASLTPSLVPRSAAVQSVLSGLSFAAGYGIRLALQLLWRTLQLPAPAGRSRLWLAAGTGLLCAGLAGLALWKVSGWQNTLRALMDLPPVETARPLTIAAIALAVFLFLVLLGRLVRTTLQGLNRRLARQLPGSQAAVLALVLTALLLSRPRRRSSPRSMAIGANCRATAGCGSISTV